MKNILITLFCALSVSAFAQTGSWYIGGNGGFGSYKVEDTDASTNWNFSPEVGTFFTDNVQVGVGLNFFGGSNDVKGAGVTLYSRYFFKPGEAFRPFIGANIPYTSLESSGDPFGDIKTTSFGLNLNGGFGYALSPRWTVVGSLGVLGFASESTSLNGGDSAKATNFSLGLYTLGNPFNVGLYYTFKPATK